MYATRTIERSAGAPRIALLGHHIDSLGARDDALAGALAEVAHVREIGARSQMAAYRAGVRAVRGEDFEAVHLLDAALAPAGALIRRRTGAPVSVSVSAGRVAGGGVRGRLARRALNRLDQAFVTDHGTLRYLRAEARRLPAVLAPALAIAPAAPTAGAMAAMGRLLRGVTPGRLVIGVPWTADADYMRWHRDAVAPLLTGNPVCLLLGAPSRRQARIVFGVNGLQIDYRVHTGRLDADTVGAAARCVDAFVVAGTPRRAYSEPDLIMAMATAGAPLVAGGGLRSPVLRHESNAFIAAAGDPLSLVSTLNQLLSLPAIQRHYLGEQFAEHTLASYPAQGAAPVYAERFAALVGRPLIPENLRAA